MPVYFRPASNGIGSKPSHRFIRARLGEHLDAHPQPQQLAGKLKDVLLQPARAVVGVDRAGEVGDA